MGGGGSSSDGSSTTIRNNPYRKELKVYRKALKEKTLPPSQFSKMILDYMDNCPADERGWRPHFDIVSWMERETHRKQMFKGFRAVYMNQHQFVKFEMGKEEGLLEVDARARWEKRKKEVPSEDWEYSGDKNDILELPIVTEKYIDSSTGVMHDKEMELSGKKQKIKNEQQLAEGRADLSSGLCSFDAEMFNDVGGRIMKGALTGAQLSASTDNGRSAATAPGSALAFDSKDKNKKKEFDLDKACINLKVFIRKHIDSLKKEFKAVQEQVSTSSQLAQVAVDVPNLDEYVSLLDRRNHFMQIMLLSYEEQDANGGAASLRLEGITSAEFNQKESECRELQELIDKVNTWSKDVVATQSNPASQSGDEGPTRIVEKKIMTGEKLEECSKEIQDMWNTLSWRSKLAFRKMSWDVDESKFTQPVDFNALTTLLMHLHVCLQSESRLASAVQKSLDERHPLPLLDMESVVCLASLEFDEAMAPVASSETETKTLEQTVASNATAMAALAKKVKDAASDVKKLIEKKQKDEVKDREKAEKQKIKDAEKLEKEQSKAASAVAKAKAKSQGQAKTASTEKTAIIKEPPLLGDLSMIPDMKDFDNEDDMKKQGTPAAGVPYVIKTCPRALTEVLKERSVASAMGLFKILMMEPNNLSLKQNGRSQQPFQSDRKKRVSELMTTLAPNDILSQVARKLPEAWHQTLSQTHLFVCSEDMVQCGVERNALGNIRVQTAGVRVVVVFMYEALKEIMKTKDLTRIQDEDEVDFMRRVLIDITAKDIGERSKNMVWKYTLDASSGDLGKSPAMVIPPGSFTIEKTIPSKTAAGAVEREKSFVVGLRQHFLESHASPGHRSLKLLHDAQVSHKGTDSTATFWSKILEACHNNQSEPEAQGKGKKGNSAASAASVKEKGAEAKAGEASVTSVKEKEALGETEAHAQERASAKAADQSAEKAKNEAWEQQEAAEKAAAEKRAADKQAADKKAAEKKAPAEKRAAEKQVEEKAPKQRKK